MSDVLRLLDPDALDRKREPRGRASIVVPTAWLREGARLEVDLPTRLRCDLCDGGGCDACERSGGYRLPKPRAPLAITLPRVTDDAFALRVTNPVADASPTLLVVRVAAGLEASAGVRWIGVNHDVDPRVGGPSLSNVSGRLRTVALVALVALVAAVARLACR